MHKEIYSQVPDLLLKFTSLSLDYLICEMGSAGKVFS